MLIMNTIVIKSQPFCVDNTFIMNTIVIKSQPFCVDNAYYEYYCY
jgi:hypothetical protein